MKLESCLNVNAQTDHCVSLLEYSKLIIDCPKIGTKKILDRTFFARYGK